MHPFQLNNSKIKTPHKNWVALFFILVCFGIFQTCKLEVVKPVPIVDFEIEICSFPVGDSCLVSIVNKTLYGEKYYWDFGDGTSSLEFEPSNKYFKNDCAYFITLTSTNSSGEDSESKSIVVGINIQPTAMFTFGNQCVAGCMSGVEFINQSECSNSFQWTVQTENGVESSYSKNPTWFWQEPGDYAVTLKARYVDFNEEIQEEDTHQDTIHIYHPDELEYASALVSSSNSCAGPMCEIQFLNNSLNATQYSWDFGDGTFSNSASDTIYHTYNVTGQELSSIVEFNVKLIASNAFAEINPQTIDTTSFSIFVSAGGQSVANFEMSVDTCYVPCNVSFQNTSINALSSEWNFGDGVSSNNQNPGVHQYNSPGSYEVVLTIEGPGQETDQFSRTLVVLADCEEDWCCGDLLIDESDPDNPQTYTTASINGVCIMTQNVSKNVNTGGGSDNGLFYQSDSNGEDACLPEQYYYSWAGITQDDSPACPTGWHIPNIYDLTAIFGDLNNPSFLTSDFELTGSNSTGFSASPTGYVDGSQGGCDQSENYYYWAQGQGNNLTPKMWFWQSESNEFTFGPGGELLDPPGGATKKYVLRCVKD